MGWINKNQMQFTNAFNNLLAV